MMATTLHDTGEAYLSAEEKGFVRGANRAPTLHRPERRALSATLTSAALALVIAGVGFLAASI